ncbi:AMP-dependent synthetase/ligase [Polymorphobacter fuscus]|uniref:AMP-binding protein n=1 Tax=Sandarakinorhabdus fusca TaxID=1439888 RepID=A0A7C9GR31_9SPHN|nr:AMP-dependent synthetase/ligase [Polymorphobacter fuscus]KAB7644926.1 long-chain fatty acid--CoA ligase [Polymorphobacter fuscus]MQT18213.1 AMP-binding protein [Polymorphobacter fuscus]NJC09535.1 long-chain acyl-CoA synthetase [Polymorphobacter fuscus]
MAPPKFPPLRPARLAARVDAAPNLVTLFLDMADERGEAPFLSRKLAGVWQTLSWAQCRDIVASLSAALIGLGIKRGDRIALVSENRPEWCLADLAIMAAGGITVPAYTTNTQADHSHILGNSGARAVIVSGPKLAATLLPAVAASDNCRIVIGIDPLKDGQSSDIVDELHIHQWQAIVAARAGHLAEDIAAMRARTQMQRHDLACLIYTSGTGGAPRGVRQHHGAIMRNIAGAITIIEQDFEPGDVQGELFLSFLPLSHAYEHTAGQYMPLGMGGQIYYAEGLEKLAANIEETQPTFMVVVPRLFEVLRTRIAKQIEKQGGVAVTLLNQALRLARKEARGEPLNIADRLLDAALERTIRKSIRAKFGGRLKGLVAGGAPLNPEVGVFFSAIGIMILQGYGQTEAGPVISCNRPRAKLKMHTVGPPLTGVEVRIAPDGEILVRGELVMDGYWMNDAESHKVLQDGWLLTGDIGHCDKDGHLVITDRKKDILINDKGDNVAPQRVEGMLTLQDEIAQAMVYGDKRPYLVGVVVPETEWALCWARDKGVAPDLKKLAKEPEFHRAVMAAVDRVNARLSVVEKVRRIIIADEAFTTDNQQMTPSLKIRRHVLKQVYGARLDKLYAG